MNMSKDKKEQDETVKTYSEEEVTALIDQKVKEAVDAERVAQADAEAAKERTFPLSEVQELVANKVAETKRDFMVSVEDYVKELHTTGKILTHERDKAIRWVVDHLRAQVNSR